MARFPSRQEEVVALAENVLKGLKDNKDIYPAPELDLVEFQAVIDSYCHAVKEQEEAKTAYKLAIMKKDEVLDAMKIDLKAQLRYAENMVGPDDEKLKLLGWGCKRENVALSVPGQPLELKAVRQKKASLELSWKKPADGGAIAVYNVMRSVNAEAVDDEEIEWVGDWEFAEAALVCRITLTDEPQNIRLAYRVIGLNKAGEGIPSNTVLAVL